MAGEEELMETGILITPQRAAKLIRVMLETAVAWKADATLADIRHRMAESILERQTADGMDLLTISLLKNIAERFGLEAKASDVLLAGIEAERILNEMFGEDKGSTDTSVSGDERAHSE